MQTEKIFDGMDYARRENCRTIRHRILKIVEKAGLKFIDQKAKGEPVKAEINAGRWIAKCPDCAGAEAVSSIDPIFYCFSCGNEKVGGRWREVVFPENKGEIEAALLKRRVKYRSGRDEISRALTAKPDPLPRAWTPTESVEDLLEQNMKAGV